MTREIVIHPEGNVSIAGLDFVLHGGVEEDAVLAAFSDLRPKTEDYGNGYSWIRVQDGLSFAGAGAGIGLMFHNRRLERFSFGVSRSDEQLENGWPTSASCQEDVRFMRSALRTMLDKAFGSDTELFDWGKVVCLHDRIGGAAHTDVIWA